jgi:hypothetical protein
MAPILPGAWRVRLRIAGCQGWYCHVMKTEHQTGPLCYSPRNKTTARSSEPSGSKAGGGCISPLFNN